MSRFTGILLINQNQSSVNGELLLMAEDNDADQAMSDATAFVKRKGFQSGFAIVVIGTNGQIGTVNGIVMTDAVAPTAAAAAPVVETIAAPTKAKVIGKKAAVKKKVAAPKRPKKKKTASKARKRRTHISPKVKRKSAAKKSKRTK